MPPRSRTRALYIEYQQGLRPAVEQRDLVKEWYLIPQNDRQPWVNAYNAVQAAKAVVNQHRPAAVAASGTYNAAVTAINNRNPATFIALARAIDRALPLWHLLPTAYYNLGAAWHNLRQREGHLPVAVRHAASINNARNERQDAFNEYNTANGLIALYRYMRDEPPVPRDANQRKRMPEGWASREKVRDIAGAKFQASRAPDAIGLAEPGDGLWVSRNHVEGGMGTGSVWFQLDGYRNITDRVFRKEVQMGEYEWSNPRSWHGDIRDPNTRMPNELACHGALMRVQHLDAVVNMKELPHRNHVFDDSLQYRIFMEYCPFGDLNALIRAHLENNEHISESFIWYTAASLVEAGLAMLQGSIDTDNNDDTDEAPENLWKEEIIHRDIKPANILFAEPDEDRWTLYPTPVLADFGLAFMTPKDDPNNPRWYNKGGTPGFRAPEQHRWIDAETLERIDEWELREYTNVFGVGMVLWCLVMLHESPREPGWLGRGEQDTTLDLPANAWPSDQYSQPLKDMIASWVAYSWEDRATFADLKEEIERRTMTGFEHTMRLGTASQATQDQHRLWLTEERYKIGMVLPGGA